MKKIVFMLPIVLLFLLENICAQVVRPIELQKPVTVQQNPGTVQKTIIVQQNPGTVQKPATGPQNPVQTSPPKEPETKNDHGELHTGCCCLIKYYSQQNDIYKWCPGGEDECKKLGGTKVDNDRCKEHKKSSVD
jgi:hypothetical protein